MLLILPNGEFVNVKGIDEHILNRIKLGTFASKVKTNRGICIFLWHNYARVLTQKRSIHSKFQLEAYGNIVWDDFLDKHQIITPCGHIVPLVQKSGLYYMEMEKPTIEDLEKHPVVVIVKILSS